MQLKTLIACWQEKLMTNSTETQNKTRLEVEESEDAAGKQAGWKELKEKSAPDLVVASQTEIVLESNSASDNENVGAVTEPSAAVLAPLSEATAAAAEGASTQADRGAPRLPQARYGLLTALAFFVVLLGWLPVEITSPGRSGGFTCLLMLIVFIVLHIFWLYKSRVALEKATSQYLPESGPKDKFWLSLIFYSLPFCWITIAVVVVSNSLQFSAFPIISYIPTMVLISIAYFLGVFFAWPRKLKKLFYQEYGAELKKGKKGAPGGNVRFPSLWMFLLAWPFGGTAYVSYWKQALAACEKARNIQTGKREAKVSLKERNRFIIKYDSFAAYSRWMRQRKKAMGGWRSLVNGVLAIAADFVLILLALAYGPQAFNFLLGLLGNGGAGGGEGSGGNLVPGLPPVNHLYFYGLAVVLITTAIAFIRHVFRQPTNYEFNPFGFQAFRRTGSFRDNGTFIEWSNVHEIRLLKDEGNSHNTDSVLEFHLKIGEPVKLKLSSIDSVDDKEAILVAIERWAPAVSRDAEVIQALQPPAGNSYTELWLQALAAPPQRDRLQPLSDGMIVGEGRYRVKRALGVGGQGAAYEAVDQDKAEIIVLKEFLLPIYVDVNIRKEVLERFESEARILKHLDHDQVVKLSDFFVEDHRAYLVLEHIDGISLREKVRQEGPLSEEVVRELAKQMCTILSYLHSQEPPVVHRDFTPENLILRKDGVLKLIDFNVARQVESNATGSVVGKPAYLPPEQFRGEPVSQSDIYALGATLNFLLTGEDPEPITSSHPRKKTATVSETLDKIVAQATAIDLKKRFADSDQLLSALEENDSSTPSSLPLAEDDTSLLPSPEAALTTVLEEPGESSESAPAEPAVPSENADAGDGDDAGKAEAADDDGTTGKGKEQLEEKSGANDKESDASAMELGSTVGSFATDLPVAHAATLAVPRAEWKFKEEIEKPQLKVVLAEIAFEPNSESKSELSTESDLQGPVRELFQPPSEVAAAICAELPPITPISSSSSSSSSSAVNGGKWHRFWAYLRKFGAAVSAFLLLTTATLAVNPQAAALLDPKGELHRHLWLARKASSNYGYDRQQVIEQECRKCLELDPTCVAAWEGLAEAAVSKKDYSTAEMAFRKALALTPDDQNLLLYYGSVEN
jgi:serine/threonine protein kinase